MTRYRSPSLIKSPYITPEGYRTLQTELKSLWQRRAEVTLALSAAAAEGDRSENAEYIYRKKELREIDRRIRYLQKRLPELNVVEATGNKERIYFGALIVLEDEAGQERTYRIVGPDEFDTAKGWISMDSPLAKALMKKAVDEEVVVETPAGMQHYSVLEIHYQPKAITAQT